MISPHLIPLPPSAQHSPSPSFHSSSTPSRSPLPTFPSPRTILRPELPRSTTSQTILPLSPPDPFHEGSTISVNQPVGSLSISPSSRDVCLASRKGLYILDLEDLNSAPRFVPQGGTWQIADCQWSPHPSTSSLILSTSSQKLLVWDLSAPKPLYRSISAHARAITDINWHAHNPNLMATVSMDAGIRGWDLRCADDQPFMRLCAWGVAGTQVKWSRGDEGKLATAHGKEVFVWDVRKGSVPVVTLKAHDSKIYGIDWDRRERSKLVTCSLDKTIKYWTIPALGAESTSSEPHATTITTHYPVWRARNLPFGHGVLSLPQRGETALELFGMKNLVNRFEGHEDVVKEFVWRSRGGSDQEFDDREFQLISWGKDRTLRIWPVGREITEKVGFKYGEPIKVLVSRRGAKDISYTKAPYQQVSGISKLKPVKDTGMTRGGGRLKAMDQLDWLTKVVKSTASPDSSVLLSRGSVSRSRPGSLERHAGWLSLKDEVVKVNRIFPRPLVNFEKIDLTHRRLTITLLGPWANGNRMAFIRIHWSFSPQYPYALPPPTFELERNPTIAPPTRARLVMGIKDLRANNRQCIVASVAFLLGGEDQGRLGRVLMGREDDEESLSSVEATNVPMLGRNCGASWGPDGQLVCFFPKQTVLPRIRGVSRSPSVPRDVRAPPLLKAMSALSRLENPNQRRVVRVKQPRRRLDPTPQPVQASSTLTIHTWSNGPSRELAKLYGESLEGNLQTAFEMGRLDHARVWATISGLLSELPPKYEIKRDERRERDIWERGVVRRRLILDEIFTELIHTRDVQLLVHVSLVILSHIKSNPAPPIPQSVVVHSPEQDYFTLPPHSFHSPIPTTRQNTASPGLATSASYRNSGWSLILNPSSISLRNAGASGISLRGATPRERSSSELPRPLTPHEEEDKPQMVRGVSIPVPGSAPRGLRERTKSTQSQLTLGTSQGVTPLKSTPSQTGSGTASGSDAYHSAGRFGNASGSASPLRRYMSRNTTSASITSGVGKQSVNKVCTVKIELLEDTTPSPCLLDEGMRVKCEGFKLIYADFLLRWELLGIRTRLLKTSFIETVKKSEPVVHDEISNVCMSCAVGLESCPRCEKKPKKPICAYCRLTIKGLGNTCSNCDHYTHVKCLRKHFTSHPSCPACACPCTVHPPRPIPIPLAATPSPPPTYSRGLMSSRGRITHASLGAIRETGTGVVGAGGLGLNPEGGQESGYGQGWLRFAWTGGPNVQGNGLASGREGLLSRTRLGGFRSGDGRGGAKG